MGVKHLPSQRCAWCGYIIDPRVASETCPECGRTPFADPMFVRHAQWKTASRRALPLLLVLVFVPAAVIGGLASVTTATQTGPAILTVLIAGFVALGIWGSWQWCAIVVVAALVFAAPFAVMSSLYHADSTLPLHLFVGFVVVFGAAFLLGRVGRLVTLYFRAKL